MGYNYCQYKVSIPRKSRQDILILDLAFQGESDLFRIVVTNMVLLLLNGTCNLSNLYNFGNTRIIYRILLYPHKSTSKGEKATFDPPNLLMLLLFSFENYDVYFLSNKRLSHVIFKI